MSVNSMTGFSRTEFSNDKFEVTCEIKSVNHRFKDFRFRMHNSLNHLELEIRRMIEASLSRGSFDISIQTKKVLKNDESKIDFEKVKNFINSFKENMNFEGNLNPTHFLRPEFYKETLEEDKDALSDVVKSVCKDTIIELKKSRASEGEKLESILLANINVYRDEIKKVSDLRVNYKDNLEKKLLERLKEKELESEVDEPRFYKEIIYYLEKMDVDEELDRAVIHIDKLESIIKSDKKNSKGREIEFVLQEMNREINTIGSKSNTEEISNSVVKSKLALEKMREQALNIQ